MKTIVSLFIGLQLATFSAHAAVPTADSAATAADVAARQRELNEIARVATIMIDGDVCQHIVTARALAHMLHRIPATNGRPAITTT